MPDVHAPGWTADWLNAWLAAIGVTVLLPDVKLHWEQRARPHAVFTAIDDSPLWPRVAGAMPTVETLDQSPIAGMERKVDIEEYRRRASASRRATDSIAVSLTDLCDLDKDAHGPFDPSGPGTTKGQYTRLVKCISATATDVLADALERSAAGRPTRVEGFGLGFDYRRLVSGEQSRAAKQVDPVVEVLSWSALRLFPVRGDGRRPRQRGWTNRVFAWWAWEIPLDRWGIDALLDRLPQRSAPRTMAAYESAKYEGQGSDAQVAYGSRRLA